MLRGEHDALDLGRSQSLCPAHAEAGFSLTNIDISTEEGCRVRGDGGLRPFFASLALKVRPDRKTIH